MGRQGSYSGCSGKGSHLDSHLPQLSSSCGSPRDPSQMLCPYSRPEHINIAGDMWHRLWIYKHHMVMVWHFPLQLLCMHHLHFLSFIWPFPRSAHLDQAHCFLLSMEMHLLYLVSGKHTISIPMWRNHEMTTDQPGCIQSRIPPLWLPCYLHLHPGPSLYSDRTARGSLCVVLRLILIQGCKEKEHIWKHARAAKTKHLSQEVSCRISDLLLRNTALFVDLLL